MNYIKDYKDIVQSFPNSKLLFRKYNKTALVLTEYELVHYKAWLKMVDNAQKYLQVIIYIGALEVL